MMLVNEAMLNVMGKIHQFLAAQKIEEQNTCAFICRTVLCRQINPWCPYRAAQAFWNTVIFLSINFPFKPKPGTSWFQQLCHELVCIMMKWTWYSGRDHFFHITSGRINTWKCVNQLKELFFLNLIIFLNIYYFLQFITKTGFCCKFLSLNDLTPSPISRPGTGNPLFTMTTSQCACKPVMTTRAFSRWNQHCAKALCWKSWGRKKVLVMLGYHSIQHMLSI